MHHLTCGISSLLRSVNLFLFTFLLVHLILHNLVITASVVTFTDPFFHSLSGSIYTASADLGLVRNS